MAMHIIGNKIDFTLQVKSFLTILTGIIILFGIIYSFGFLIENTLISLGKLGTISFCLSSVTLLLFFRKQLAFLIKLRLIAVAFTGLSMLFYSYLFLGINYLNFPNNKQNIQCSTIGFYKKTSRFNQKSSYATVAYEDRIIKVKIPYNPFYNTTQYPSVILTTRSGLLGLEVLVETELLQGSPPPTKHIKQKR